MWYWISQDFPHDISINAQIIMEALYFIPVRNY